MVCRRWRESWYVLQHTIYLGLLTETMLLEPIGAAGEWVELGRGTGRSIQEAKDAAAWQAYESLRVRYPNAGLPALV
jgi:hypothetical protein